jgi:shikimate 5-dehydrogenase
VRFTDIKPHHKQLAYKVNTPLLQQIRHLRQTTGQAWVTVDGFEFIPEQGIAQFELMTGRKAPRNRMRTEVVQNYQMMVDQQGDMDMGMGE